MAEVLELVLWVLLELGGQLLFEVLVELGLSSSQEALGRRNRHPLLATLGYLLLGALAGALSVWLLPGRWLEAGPFPGLSVLLAPLAAGLAMECWGRYRRRRGHATTNLATWYGGAALAFSFALVRYLGVA